jgi:hypothetical protein
VSGELDLPKAQEVGRPCGVQTGEGELDIEISKVREAAKPFVSKMVSQICSGGGDVRVEAEGVVRVPASA